MTNGTTNGHGIDSDEQDSNETFENDAERIMSKRGKKSKNSADYQSEVDQTSSASNEVTENLNDSLEVEKKPIISIPNEILEDLEAEKSLPNSNNRRRIAFTVVQSVPSPIPPPFKRRLTRSTTPKNSEDELEVDNEISFVNGKVDTSGFLSTIHDSPSKITIKEELVESKTKTPGVESTPEAPAEESTPKTPVVESTPETIAEESTPEIPAVESKPETPAVNSTTETPATESTPETPAEESKPETPAVESTPETPDVESSTEEEEDTPMEVATPMEVPEDELEVDNEISFVNGKVDTKVEATSPKEVATSPKVEATSPKEVPTSKEVATLREVEVVTPEVATLREVEVVTPCPMEVTTEGKPKEATPEVKASEGEVTLEEPTIKLVKVETVPEEENESIQQSFANSLIEGIVLSFDFKSALDMINSRLLTKLFFSDKILEFRMLLTISFSSSNTQFYEPQISISPI